MDLKKLKIKAEKEISACQDLKSLDEVYKQYLGKKGMALLLLAQIKDLPEKKRAKAGEEINELKKSLEAKVVQKREKLGQVSGQEVVRKIDITVPGKKPTIGHLHPLTQVKREVMYLFQNMGFAILEGPLIESEWYNFDALNIPPDHPARDEWDTLWLRQNSKSKTKNPKLLLRTHTSPMQVRYMEKHNPPLRAVVIGDCFRHEATDASHEFHLGQVEGIMLGKDISAAHFKGVITTFFKAFLKREIQVRLRPDYFPFTEPSFEASITCLVCGGKGCPACKKSGFMEMMGAGMVHPKVLKNSGLNPQNWQGWAFGIGWDRLAMMRFKIGDIRLLKSGDLRFLNQF